MTLRRDAGTWYGEVNEDGSFSILARITALDAAGQEVVPREGPCLTQADVASIACRVFDLGRNKDNPAGSEVLPAPTLTPAANIFDTLRTSGWPLDRDIWGYNFRHDVSPIYDGSPGTASLGEWYLLEYKITLTNGGIVWLRVKVKTVAVQSS